MPHFRSLRLCIAIAALMSVLSTGALASAQKTTAAPTSQTKAHAQGVVNLNTASETELARLPGIGPKKAQAILALRKSMKRFSRVEAIMRVKGIGRATFRKLRPMLTLQGETTLQARAGRGSSKR